MKRNLVLIISLTFLTVTFICTLVLKNNGYQPINTIQTSVRNRELNLTTQSSLSTTHETTKGQGLSVKNTSTTSSSLRTTRERTKGKGLSVKITSTISSSLNTTRGTSKCQRLSRKTTSTTSSSLSTTQGKTNDQGLSEEITLVTAYWNLGKFQKGSGSLYFDTKLYHEWTNVFRYIMNPLIVYTDSCEFALLAESLRNSTAQRTQIHLVNRSSTRAFRNINRIREIYSIPGYPKHHPNTVLPEYACAQHAKYDVTVWAAIENVYRTTYFAWLDIGYFRNRKSSKLFHLVKPKHFNDSFVAMNEVSKRQNASTETIFKNNIFWVGGGLFIGRHDVIVTFGTQFQRAVKYFLSRNLSNTDQQVIYAMFSEEGHTHIKPEVAIQNYMSNGDWFFLGTQMVEELPSEQL